MTSNNVQANMYQLPLRKFTGNEHYGVLETFVPSCKVFYPMNNLPKEPILRIQLHAR
jgi:hypothetical protein